MVHLVAHGIPELRRQLPFVYQARPFAGKQFLDVDVGQPDVRLLGVGVVHVEDTGGLLFASSCLSAPLWSLDENGPKPAQFSGEQIIRNSLPVPFHPFYGSIFRIGAQLLFGSLHDIRSGVCMEFVRQFVRKSFGSLWKNQSGATQSLTLPGKKTT